jgi:hypothetical protein
LPLSKEGRRATKKEGRRAKSRAKAAFAFAPFEEGGRGYLPLAVTCTSAISHEFTRIAGE